MSMSQSGRIDFRYVHGYFPEDDRFPEPEIIHELEQGEDEDDWNDGCDYCGGELNEKGDCPDTACPASPDYDGGEEEDDDDLS